MSGSIPAAATQPAQPQQAATESKLEVSRERIPAPAQTLSQIQQNVMAQLAQMDGEATAESAAEDRRSAAARGSVSQPQSTHEFERRLAQTRPESTSATISDELAQIYREHGMEPPVAGSAPAQGQPAPEAAKPTAPLPAAGPHKIKIGNAELTPEEIHSRIVEADLRAQNAARSIQEAQQAFSQLQAQQAALDTERQMAEADPEAYIAYRNALAARRQDAAEFAPHAQMDPAAIAQIVDQRVQQIEQARQEQAVQQKKQVVVRTLEQSVEQEVAALVPSNADPKRADRVARLVASRAADLVMSNKITRDTPPEEIRGLIKQIVREEVDYFGSISKSAAADQLQKLANSGERVTVSTGGTAPSGTISPAAKAPRPDYSKMSAKDLARRIEAEMTFLEQTSR